MHTFEGNLTCSSCSKLTLQLAWPGPNQLSKPAQCASQPAPPAQPQPPELVKTRCQISTWKFDINLLLGSPIGGPINKLMALLWRGVFGTLGTKGPSPLRSVVRIRGAKAPRMLTPSLRYEGPLAPSVPKTPPRDSPPFSARKIGANAPADLKRRSLIGSASPALSLLGGLAASMGIPHSCRQWPQRNLGQ